MFKHPVVPSCLYPNCHYPLFLSSEFPSTHLYSLNTHVMYPFVPHLCHICATFVPIVTPISPQVNTKCPFTPQPLISTATDPFAYLNLPHSNPLSLVTCPTHISPSHPYPSPTDLQPTFTPINPYPTQSTHSRHPATFWLLSICLYLLFSFCFWDSIMYLSPHYFNLNI